MSPHLRFPAAVAAFALVAGAAIAADWPGFRGARGGVAADTDLPVTWTSDNFLWKVKFPGPGTSSPIVTSDKVLLTCYTGYGTTLTKGMSGKGGFGKGKGKGKGSAPVDAGEQKALRLVLLCYDRADGGLRWKNEIEPKLPEAAFSGFLREHGYASSTPVTDGERVYVFFGKTGVFAFDLAGQQLWHADVGSTTDKWGTAASPVLYQDLVIVNASIESKALVALDKRTGKEKWRVTDLGRSWASPILVDTKAGKTELVLSLPSKVVGYDPATGAELWHCEGVSGGKGGRGGFGGGEYGGGYTGSTPVARDGIVYVIGGGGPAPQVALAIRAGGKGAVDKTHVLWRARAGSSTCSPVLCGDYLCWVSGTAQCLRTKDGTTAHQERLYDARGEYVSAVAAGDKLYALTRFDGLFVLGVGDKLAELAHNTFAGDSSIFNASPAVADGRLYIRSNEYLYCVGKK